MLNFVAATLLLASMAPLVSSYSKHYELSTASLTIETKHHYPVDKGKITDTSVSHGQTVQHCPAGRRSMRHSPAFFTI